VSRESSKAAIEPEATLLVDFVNTYDVEDDVDSIADPAGLRAWIGEHGGEYVPELDEADVSRILALRESLRGLLLANNGGGAGEAELQPLREAAERSRYRPALSAGGELVLEPARSDLSGFEARLLLAVERLQSHGAWPRLKACTDEKCHWAFYDTTRNRSRTWCSMDVCGNREKTRRYRTRKGERGD
jgi:predicted RNA-binding Zn ribbon-like protein